MRPGRVIGKRGRAIKEASEKLESQLGLSNPQITVIEVEVPELNPMIMASRVANALERGVHFRRAVFWSLNRIMESGALGCEIILKGPLRSARSRFEKVVEGYVPKSGDPALKYVKSATMHVKMKRGVLGVTVNIVAPDAKFPDKVNLDNLPEIKYQLPLQELETPVSVEKTVLKTEIETTVEVADPEEIVETPEIEIKTESEPELETPELVEEPTEVESEQDVIETVETSEPDLVPTEEEVDVEPLEKRTESELEPLLKVEEEEEPDKQPETEEE
jgi:small subunit ribosomal protein S3